MRNMKLLHIFPEYVIEDLTEGELNGNNQPATADKVATVEPAKPKFSLRLKGSPAGMSMTLFAIYGDVAVSANAPDPRGDFAIPDNTDFYLYYVRNTESERRAP